MDPEEHEDTVSCLIYPRIQDVELLVLVGMGVECQLVALRVLLLTPFEMLAESLVPRDNITELHSN